MSHTPGPWHVVNPPKGAILSSPPAVYAEGWQTICTLRTRPSHTQGVDEINARIAADARLIAAAPELLAVVRAILEPHETEWFLNRVEAVIAKVEGTTP